MSTSPRPRPGILALTPYVGGDHSPPAGARLRANRAVRLASNENPLGAGKAAQAAYLAAAGELHRYPDGDSRALREALGAAEGVNPARIVCGAGSDELIQLLVKAYAGPGDEVLHTRHGFLIYAIAAKAAGATPVAAPETDLTADVDALLERVGDRTRLVFLANPNNPTGSLVSDAELRRLHAGLPPDVLLVIDSAYAEYVMELGYDPGSVLVGEAQNVVMLRTFSKIHGLAALRLGWAYASLAVADVLNRVRGPFNVTATAQAAGLAALWDRAHVEASRRHNARLLPWFSAALRKLGFTVAPSAGNFVLLRLENAAAAQAALEQLKAEGILVRAMGGYGLPESLRITIGTEEDLQAVLDSLADWKARR
jgi:histidinol-phosphate aminotransferase